MHVCVWSILEVICCWRCVRNFVKARTSAIHVTGRTNRPLCSCVDEFYSVRLCWFGIEVSLALHLFDAVIILFRKKNRRKRKKMNLSPKTNEKTKQMSSTGRGSSVRPTMTMSFRRLGSRRRWPRRLERENVFASRSTMPRRRWWMRRKLCLR